MSRLFKYCWGHCVFEILFHSIPHVPSYLRNSVRVWAVPDFVASAVYNELFRSVNFVCCLIETIIIHNKQIARRFGSSNSVCIYTEAIGCNQVFILLNSHITASHSHFTCDKNAVAIHQFQCTIFTRFTMVFPFFRGKLDPEIDGAVGIIFGIEFVISFSIPCYISSRQISHVQSWFICLS